MLKKDLRILFKEKRLALSESVYEKNNDLILIQLQQLELPFLHNIISYFPDDSRREPDTFLITRYLKFINPQLNIAYPTVRNDDTMIAVIANVDSEFVTNKFGINELTTGAVMHPKDIDLVIVPMLTCNYKGFRVGYGKGFYDKYLVECRPDIVKIGLSFFDPVDTISDVNQFDVPLTHCITTDIIYEF